MTETAEPGSPKLADYFAHHNPDILDVLPADARRFLDIGCAEGKLGAEIKERVPGAVVHGVDREPKAVARAGEVLDRAFEADLEAGLPELEGPYDCVIFGDVLEHLVDPWTVLRRFVGVLSPGGHVVASLPNLRYYKVARDLVLGGRFTYRERGILDATHLRFFTLKEMRRLFDSAGLEVTAERPRVHGGNTLLKLLSALFSGPFEEMRAVQYTLVGRRRGGGPDQEAAAP